MARFLICAPLVLACIKSVCPTVSGAQSQVSTPVVVLEATSTLRGSGHYENQHLVVRLATDGNVEWDKAVGNAVWERQTGAVDAERVREIRRTLNAIDKNSLKGKMGPYHIYVDTSVELQIHLVVGQETVAFSVINPWLPDAWPKHKPMPKDVKIVVCVIDRLQAQVASMPVNELCKGPQPSH
jgi:hypothetical protein